MKLDVRNLTALLVWSLLVGVCGCDGRSDMVDSSAPASPTPVLIRTARAKLGTLAPSVSLVGSLMPVPEQMAVLSTQVGGQVAKVAVVEGQYVHTGDTVVELDSRMRRLELDKAQAALAAARATLDMLENGPRPQEIEATRSEAAKADSAVQAFKMKLEALTPLLENGEISRVRYEEVKSDLEAAEANSAASKAQLELMEKGTRAESLEEARARVHEAQADLAVKQLAVELSTVLSPIDGVVTSLPVRVGMYLDQSAGVATVVHTSRLFARVRVPANHAPSIAIGDHADVTVLSLPDRVFPGTVARTAQEADPKTGDIDTFVLIENEERLLQPGLACTARIWLPEIPDAITIPAAAVSDRDGTPVVTVVHENRAYEVGVVLGARTKEYAQILDGVAPGDLVATEGGYGLPEGYPVKVDEK